MKKQCMQPITVYGIETTGCVLKAVRTPKCMQPITVYGIETSLFDR